MTDDFGTGGGVGLLWVIGTQCNHKGPYGGRWEAREVRERCMDRSKKSEREVEDGALLPLKMEGGDASQGGWQLLEAGKGKETDCPVGPLKETQPC